MNISKAFKRGWTGIIIFVLIQLFLLLDASWAGIGEVCSRKKENFLSPHIAISAARFQQAFKKEHVKAIGKVILIPALEGELNNALQKKQPYSADHFPGEIFLSALASRRLLKAIIQGIEGLDKIIGFFEKSIITAMSLLGISKFLSRRNNASIFAYSLISAGIVLGIAAWGILPVSLVFISGSILWKAVKLILTIPVFRRTAASVIVLAVLATACVCNKVPIRNYNAIMQSIPENSDPEIKKLIALMVDNSLSLTTRMNAYYIFNKSYVSEKYEKKDVKVAVPALISLYAELRKHEKGEYNDILAIFNIVHTLSLIGDERARVVFKGVKRFNNMEKRILLKTGAFLCFPSSCALTACYPLLFPFMTLGLQGSVIFYNEAKTADKLAYYYAKIREAANQGLFILDEGKKQKEYQEEKQIENKKNAPDARKEKNCMLPAVLKIQPPSYWEASAEVFHLHLIGNSI
ncbi:MAG: hypothetical protein L6416_02035 [Candidatus Omnitrophica bacterium]|nr:hypothetical protein [Candidatus Omnitrophota bacterium]